MSKIKYTFILAITMSCFFFSCEGDDIVEADSQSRVEISFGVNNFAISLTRSTHPGTPQESEIQNLYLLLFDAAGVNPLKYYISEAKFNGGEWSNSDNKVLLNLTPAEAGERQVYIIANIADMKSELDTVTTLSGLHNLKLKSSTPWSNSITTPLLMSGNVTHNFITQGHQLNKIYLTRAVAKIELNISLGHQHQGTPVINKGLAGNTTAEYQYHYRFLNFSTETYILKPLSNVKSFNLVSSATSDNPLEWSIWSDSGDITSYTLNEDGKVIELRLTTYLNAREIEATASPPHSSVEISVPFIDMGPLPPPEFAYETYRVLLGSEIKRNHWYQFDIEI